MRADVALCACVAGRLVGWAHHLRSSCRTHVCVGWRCARLSRLCVHAVVYVAVLTTLPPHPHPPDEVELVSRCMRKFDVDDLVCVDAAALGEPLIKAGGAMQHAHTHNPPMHV